MASASGVREVTEALSGLELEGEDLVENWTLDDFDFLRTLGLSAAPAVPSRR